MFGGQWYLQYDMRDAEIDFPKRLVFKTWNTSLNPPLGKGHALICFVLKEINELLRDCDVLYLCEFECSDKVIKVISRLQTRKCFDENNIYGKVLIPLNRRKGNASHKSALFFNPEVFEKVKDPEYFFEPVSGMNENNYRIGQLVTLALVGSKTRVNFFCSHWPGHNEVDGEDRKTDAASTVYSLMRGRIANECVVCMGDYNSEPYEKAFAHMGASRSKAYVMKFGKMYNPFWKCLSENCGTLMYLETNRYKAYSLLYDQILVNKRILEEYNEVIATVLNVDKKLVKGEHNPVAIELIRR